MATPGVEWSADVAQAEWIRARLGPFDSRAATSVVPAGFAAYARVLHPAHDREGRPVRWSEVAARKVDEAPKQWVAGVRQTVL